MNRRRIRQFTALGCLIGAGALLAGCPDETNKGVIDAADAADTGADLGQPDDGGAEEAGVDPGGDATSDSGLSDVAEDLEAVDSVAPADPGEDGPEDGGVEDAVDATEEVDAADALDVIDPSCGPIECALDCPHGLRRDEQGCPVCRCRDCAEAEDCADVIFCEGPRCGEDGVCRCDCTAVDDAPYTCPSGAVVPGCSCSVLGQRCLEHPEYQCPTLCAPGAQVDYPCAHGGSVPWCTCEEASCVPECRSEPAVATEGWYDPCTDGLLLAADCALCTAVCAGIGTDSEGWVDSCHGSSIAQTACGPRYDCIDSPEAQCGSSLCSDGESAGLTCKDGETVPFCACELPDGPCPPQCEHVGTAEEGWYDACSGQLVTAVKCDGCTAECGAIGTKSEGWYSSCSGLIAWAMCGTGFWTCGAAPWEQCTGAADCAGEGAELNLTGEWATCCPGLTMSEAQGWDPESGCSSYDCDCRICSYCGDGACIPPENPCSCPADCFETDLPRGLFGFCGSTAECIDDLTCAGTWMEGGVGVCTEPCDPLSRAMQCGGWLNYCQPVPEAAAPGLCLAPCETDEDCAPPLTCGVSLPVIPGAGACYAWPPCDPLAATYCGPFEQCRVDQGEPICGPPGQLDVGAACDPTDDACAPQLVCGGDASCAPVCDGDELCAAKGYDLCVRGGQAPYGYCAHGE